MEKIPTSKKIVPQDDILDHILDRITSINKREDLYFDEETYNQFTKEKTIESKLICNTNVIEDKDIKFEQYFYVFNDSLIVTEVPSKNAESFEEVYGYNFQKSIINTEEIYRSLWHQTYD